MAMIIDCRRVQFFEYKQAEGAISRHKLKIYQSVYRPVNSSFYLYVYRSVIGGDSLCRPCRGFATSCLMIVHLVIWAVLPVIP